jgi:ankyrin repeat protein
MTSAVSQCSLYSQPGYWPGNWKLTRFIEKNTTHQEFDKQRSAYPNHQLSHGSGCGYTVLAAAAEIGNNALLLHIIGIADKTLLNTGDCEGRTPLHFAVNQHQYEAVKNLIHHNADVNISTKLWETPLRVAAETHNLAMVFLLLRNGALLPTCKEAPTLSRNAKHSIERAQKYLHDSRAQFFAATVANIDEGIIPARFPLTVLEIVAGYADFHQEWSTTFNDEEAASVSMLPTGVLCVNKGMAYIAKVMRIDPF